MQFLTITSTTGKFKVDVLTSFWCAVMINSDAQTVAQTIYMRLYDNKIDSYRLKNKIGEKG